MHEPSGPQPAEPAGPADAVAERVLPHDLDSERALLGAMILEPVIAQRAVDHVTAADFYRRGHGKIYTAIAGLLEDATAVDFITLRNAMAGAGTLEAAGGPAYLAALTDGMPKSTNWSHYAAIVRELRRHRDLIFVATKLQNEAYDRGTDSQQVLDRGDRWLQELRQGSFDEALTPPEEAVAAFLEALIERRARRNELLGVTTGLPSVDALTSGMGPGELILLAAATAAGKSALAAQIATSVARLAKLTVLYASLEMRRIELQCRIAAAETEIPLAKVRNGWLSDSELEKVNRAMAATAALRLFIDETTSLTVGQLRAKARRLAAEESLGLIVVDYVQLLTAEHVYDVNRPEQLANMSRGMKLLARELKVPVLLLSQLSRHDPRSPRAPILSDLKGSSSLEQDADQVWFIWGKEDSPLEAQLIVAKQRNGPAPEVVDLAFDRAYTRFRDLAHERSLRTPPVQPALEERF
jgi:replicative DNA helicase